MLHVGLDLSRTRLDVHAMDQTGTSVAVTTAAPDAGGLASLVHRLDEFGHPVTAVIESMNGARFIHDQLELRGWTVEIADAVLPPRTRARRRARRRRAHRVHRSYFSKKRACPLPARLAVGPRRTRPDLRAAGAECRGVEG